MKTQPVKIFAMGSCSEAADNIFAPSIFLFGCNLRCPYCMNSQLVVSRPNVPNLNAIPLDEVKKRLADDDSDWLMISGGEPLISNVDRLISLMEEIKSWGRKIGLSTNGTYPDKLHKVIPLVNYVTMDLKSNKKEDYATIFYRKSFIPEYEIDIGGNLMFDIFRSTQILREEKSSRDDFDYEYRTTLYPSMINEEVILEIAQSLFKNEKWVLQQFRHANDMLDPNEALKYDPYDKEMIDAFLELAKQYVDNVSLRYV